jgi:hypothetical protein
MNHHNRQMVADTLRNLILHVHLINRDVAVRAGRFGLTADEEAALLAEDKRFLRTLLGSFASGSDRCSR